MFMFLFLSFCFWSKLRRSFCFLGLCSYFCFYVLGQRSGNSLRK
jgi:hypothetical protein